MKDSWEHTKIDIKGHVLYLKFWKIYRKFESKASEKFFFISKSKASKKFIPAYQKLKREKQLNK